MRNYLFIVVLLSLSACVSPMRSEVGGIDITPEVRAEQETELKKAEAELKRRSFDRAEELFTLFQRQFPNSIFIQRAQFGLASSLEGQDRWAEAAEKYRQTIEATRTRQPEIAAQAMFEVSSCYENLGDEARVLASLTDAMTLEKYLTPEQAMAEIPARLAASYNRMGRTKDAQFQLLRAEQGLKEVRALKKQDISQDWLAQIYYNMGSFSTNQIAVENLQPHLDTLQMIQIFSYRSIEADGNPWSKLALQELTANYRDIWNTIQQISLNKALDYGAAKREQVDRQVAFTGQLLSLITEIRQYRPADGGAGNMWVSSFFGYVDELEKQGKDLLLANSIMTVLTPEAEKREGLKRKAKLVDPPKTKKGP